MKLVKIEKFRAGWPELKLKTGSEKNKGSDKIRKNYDSLDVVEERGKYW